MSEVETAINVHYHVTRARNEIKSSPLYTKIASNVHHRAAVAPEEIVSSPITEEVVTKSPNTYEKELVDTESSRSAVEVLSSSKAGYTNVWEKKNPEASTTFLIPTLQRSTVNSWRGIALDPSMAELISSTQTSNVAHWDELKLSTSTSTSCTATNDVPAIKVPRAHSDKVPYIVGGCTTAVLAFPVITLSVLKALGFTADGVVAGSLASRWMAKHGKNVPTGRLSAALLCASTFGFNLSTARTALAVTSTAGLLQRRIKN